MNLSGVVVANTIAPTSEGSAPAASMAARAAGRARSETSAPLSANRLDLMPVRETIHSSLVSRYFAKWSLPYAFSGSELPTPAMVECLTAAVAPWIRRSSARGPSGPAWR